MKLADLTDCARSIGWTVLPRRPWRWEAKHLHAVGWIWVSVYRRAPGEYVTVWAVTGSEWTGARPEHPIVATTSKNFAEALGRAGIICEIMRRHDCAHIEWMVDTWGRLQSRGAPLWP